MMLVTLGDCKITTSRQTDTVMWSQTYKTSAVIELTVQFEAINVCNSIDGRVDYSY